MVADAVRFVSAGTGGGSGLFYVHADHLGTPQKMTDGNQVLVWDAVFKPFGEAHSITGTASNHQRFPGQYADAETGFNYNYFRDYDPRIGRYVESDPIGLFGEDENLYRYVRNDPVNFIDPSGLIRIPPGLGGSSTRGPYTGPRPNTPNAPPKGPPPKPHRQYEVPTKPGQEFIPEEPWWIRLWRALAGEPDPEGPRTIAPVCPSDQDPRFGWPPDIEPEI